MTTTTPPLLTAEHYFEIFDEISENPPPNTNPWLVLDQRIMALLKRGEVRPPSTYREAFDLYFDIEVGLGISIGKYGVEFDGKPEGFEGFLLIEGPNFCEPGTIRTVTDVTAAMPDHHACLPFAAQVRIYEAITGSGHLVVPTNG